MNNSSSAAAVKSAIGDHFSNDTKLKSDQDCCAQVDEGAHHGGAEHRNGVESAKMSQNSKSLIRYDPRMSIESESESIFKDFLSTQLGTKFEG